MRRLVQYVEKVLGYNRVMIKGDQEQALMALRDKARALAGFEVVDEEAPIGDSQSQGDAVVISIGLDSSPACFGFSLMYPKSMHIIGTLNASPFCVLCGVSFPLLFTQNS